MRKKSMMLCDVPALEVDEDDVHVQGAELVETQLLLVVDVGRAQHVGRR
jgi:hypothetical protein